MRQTALASLAVMIVVVEGLSVGVSTAQQSQQVKPLRFEVAAIKPANPRMGDYSSTRSGPPGGQFYMVNVPLRKWIEIGLSVKDYALKAPSWLDTSRFDLVARLPADKPFDRTAGAEMMKALLIERFGLKYHEEFQTVPGYELVTDNKVLIQPTSLLDRLKGYGSGSGPTLINGHNVPISKLAEMLEDVLERPVVDATRLSDVYSFNLRWRPSDEAEVAEQRKYGKQYGFDVDSLPDSAFTALREQLGLRLQSAKVPSKVIIVDSINHQPTAN